MTVTMVSSLPGLAETSGLLVQLAAGMPAGWGVVPISLLFAGQYVPDRGETRTAMPDHHAYSELAEALADLGSELAGQAGSRSSVVDPAWLWRCIASERQIWNRANGLGSPPWPPRQPGTWAERG